MSNSSFPRGGVGCFFCLFVWFCLFFCGAENGWDDPTRRASCKVALAMIEYPKMTGRDGNGTTESTDIA